MAAKNVVQIPACWGKVNKKVKLGACAKRVAAGSHLPTPWLLEAAKKPSFRVLSNLTNSPTALMTSSPRYSCHHHHHPMRLSITGSLAEKHVVFVDVSAEVKVRLISELDAGEYSFIAIDETKKVSQIPTDWTYSLLSVAVVFAICTGIQTNYPE